NDKALPVLQTILAINPNYANTHGNLGFAYIGLKRFPEAVAELQQAIKLDRSNSQSRYNLGYAYLKMGKKAEATAVYTDLLAIDKAKANELQTLINNPTAQAANKGPGQGTGGTTNKPASAAPVSQRVDPVAVGHYEKGKAFYDAEEYAKAIPDLEMA